MSEVVLATAESIARRMPILAGFVETFDPHMAIAIPAASFIFAADLMRQKSLHRIPLQFCYVGESEKPNEFHVVGHKPLPDLGGKRVLIIDSCLDSGQTLLRMKRYLKAIGVRKAMSLVAVDKNQPNVVTVCMGSLFVMDGKNNPYIYGYGMDDTDGSARGLPYIAYRSA